MPLSVVYGCVVYLYASRGAVALPRPPCGVLRRWVVYGCVVYLDRSGGRREVAGAHALSCPSGRPESGAGRYVDAWSTAA